MATTNKQRLANDPLHTDAFLAEAERLIEVDDPLYASINLWRVAEQGIKAIASVRGWRCEGDADAYAVAEHISRLYGDSEVSGLHLAMGTFRQNFYEDWMDVEYVTWGLKGARELARLLREAHDAIPLDAPGPTEPHYLQRAAEADAQRSA